MCMCHGEREGRKAHGHLEANVRKAVFDIDLEGTWLPTTDRRHSQVECLPVHCADWPKVRTPLIPGSKVTGHSHACGAVVHHDMLNAASCRQVQTTPLATIPIVQICEERTRAERTGAFAAIVNKTATAKRTRRRRISGQRLRQDMRRRRRRR